MKKIIEQEHSPENEILAALFESYMFLIRSVYDYLLLSLSVYGVDVNSYNRFLKKIEKGEYPKLPKKLRGHIEKSRLFNEIRDLRDSISHRTPRISIYVKDNHYWVEGDIYNRDGDHKYFENSLYEKIFIYTTALFLLMSYIAECTDGLVLKDQIKYMDKKTRNKEVNNMSN